MIIALFQYIAAGLSWGLLKTFSRLEVIGRENLREASRPLIVVSNHESHIDPQLVGVALLSRPSLFPLRFMAKNKIFYIPGLNLLIWMLGAFMAHRRKGIERSLRTPLHILKHNGSVMMFPEGKVIPERAKLGEGKRGAAMLALMTGSAILPLSINAPHDLPPFIPFALGRPRIIIRIGEPFYLNNIDYPDLSDGNTKKATKAIMEKIAELYFQHQY
ncbi:MAG: 1-acyl-sn-glycerol-3-phosphate acyltransferase [Candidatus Berkelbacteria bacterium]|nr:MAG: 1-acyl-sn-glycerol-3-phosphate acyltransferase [Candidatus Berkelbacteria bacterium]QQG51598.1 MAG: 1-acyl-sn-glycerol-3-phosphate acyltransferase [Candidatus Berkelbacteria bacterium]